MHFSFPALTPGNYELWVSYGKRNGDWSVPLKLLTVNVVPPFVAAGMVYSINDCRSSDNNRMGYPFDNGEEGARTCLGDERT